MELFITSEPDLVVQLIILYNKADPHIRLKGVGGSGGFCSCKFTYLFSSYYTVHLISFKMTYKSLE